PGVAPWRHPRRGDCHLSVIKPSWQGPGRPLPEPDPGNDPAREGQGAGPTPARAPVSSPDPFRMRCSLARRGPFHEAVIEGLCEIDVGSSELFIEGKQH